MGHLFHSWEICNASVNYVCQGVSLAGVGLDFGPLWVMRYLSDCSIIKTYTPHSLSLFLCLSLSLCLCFSLCNGLLPCSDSIAKSKGSMIETQVQRDKLSVFFINDRKLSFPVCFMSFQLIHFISFFDVHVGISKDRQHISFYINIICIFLHLVIILIITIILIRSNSYWSLASQMLVVLTAWL